MFDLSFIENMARAVCNDNHQEIQSLLNVATSRGFYSEAYYAWDGLNRLKNRIQQANQYSAAPAQTHTQTYAQNTGQPAPTHGRVIYANPQTVRVQPLPSNPYPQTVSAQQQSASVYPQPASAQPLPSNPYPQTVSAEAQTAPQQPAAALPQSGGANSKAPSHAPKRKSAAAAPAPIKEYPDKSMAKRFLQAANELSTEQDASRWQKKIGSKGLNIIVLTSSNGEVWVEAASIQGNCLCAVKSGKHVYTIPSPSDPSLFNSAIPKWFNIKGSGPKYHIEGVSVGAEVSSGCYMPVMKGSIIKEG